MLVLLKIQNLALVENLRWEVTSGLTAVTGETGAGKSVIIGALKLILGQRADKSLIRSGEKLCSIEAVFEVDSPEVKNLLEEAGLPGSEENQIIIRRLISPTTSRQFVNDASVTLPKLREIGEQLVDMHGPGEQDLLFSPEKQLILLDSFAGLTAQRGEYEKVWRDCQNVRHKWTKLCQLGKASQQEIELLRHQIEEIREAEISKDEEEELEERWRRSRNSQRLQVTLSKVLALVSGSSGNMLERMGEVSRACGELERLDPQISSQLESLGIAESALKELDAQLQEYAESLETSSEEQGKIEQRINTIQSLKRKYGSTLEDVLEHAREVEARLEQIEHWSENLEQLDNELKERQCRVDILAKELSSQRNLAAPKLAQEIRNHLSQLGFRQSAFEISLEKESEPNAFGVDKIEYLFGPNPGEPLKALRQIASSGELARVMLAVKSALAEEDSIPLLVFDEIDANVGGEIARSVGVKMAILGRKHQVISITHFPQVAAQAKHHFLVEKRVEAGRTISLLNSLSGEARVDELVRMLGSAETNSARQLARDLLKQN